MTSAQQAYVREQLRGMRERILNAESQLNVLWNDAMALQGVVDEWPSSDAHEQVERQLDALRAAGKVKLAIIRAPYEPSPVPQGDGDHGDGEPA